MVCLLVWNAISITYLLYVYINKCYKALTEQAWGRSWRNGYRGFLSRFPLWFLGCALGLAFPLGPCRLSMGTWGNSSWSSGCGRCPLIYPGFSHFFSKSLFILFLCLLLRLRCQGPRGWEPVSLSRQSAHPNAQIPFLGRGTLKSRPWDKGLGPSNLLWRWFQEALASECRIRQGEEANSRNISASCGQLGPVLLQTSD